MANRCFWLSTTEVALHILAGGTASSRTTMGGSSRDSCSGPASSASACWTTMARARWSASRSQSPRMRRSTPQ
eukprot:4628940-Pyramimonas_sp.AAC.1